MTMTPTTRCSHPYIDGYIYRIRRGLIPASKEIHQACDYVEDMLSEPGINIDVDKIDKAVELIERYFEFRLLDWELFVLALIHCYHEPPDTVVFDEFLILMGRGNGKNGFISCLIWYLTTHYHGVQGYNIDIIANNEEQAKTSFDDVYNVLERTWKRSKKFFYKTKLQITNLRTKSYIKYNTSNARTKDGKRSACLVFDEIHEYEDWDTIKVFRSGFGKRKHSRTFFITTNGYVRGGVLDQQLELAEKVLSGEITEIGMLPLIYKLDDEKEVEDPDMWVKANPSAPYFPELRKAIESDLVRAQYQTHRAIDVLTKRMNLPREDTYTVVAPWDQVLATHEPIPYDELEGLSCIGAIHYAQATDLAGGAVWLKYRGKRYWVEHSFVCPRSLTMESRRIKAPIREWAEQGLLTIINRDSITAADVAQWFVEQGKRYNIINILSDRYRVEV